MLEFVFCITEVPQRMEEDNIKLFEQLSSAQKEEFAAVFIEGFGHLFNAKRNLGKFTKLIIASFNPDQSHAYMKNEKVVGILLLATNKVRPLKFNEEVAKALFGKFKGTAMCRQMNGIFQSKVVENDTDLYIDVLAVSKNAQRQGIASKLLQFAFAVKGFNVYYLEVLSKNKNAKQLYDKIGFLDIKKSYFSPVRLLGYGYPIKMKKT